MKILLISGHKSGNANGGNGYKEWELNIEQVNMLAKVLKEYIDVQIYPVDRDAFQDVQSGNFHIDADIDYVFECHFNAFSDPSAHGSTIFVTYAEAGIGVEQTIMRHMAKYFRLRDNHGTFDGVSRTNFAVINKCKNMGISAALMETCFMTNANDMNIYQSNKNAINKGMAEAILKGFGVDISQEQEDEPETTKPSLPTDEVTKGKYVYEKLDYGIVFNPEYYYNRYPDLQEAIGMNPEGLFQHFINHGMSERRQAISSFNVRVYQQHEDLIIAHGTNWKAYYEHFIIYGHKEVIRKVT